MKISEVVTEVRQTVNTLVFPRGGGSTSLVHGGLLTTKTGLIKSPVSKLIGNEPEKRNFDRQAVSQKDRRHLAGERKYVGQLVSAIKSSGEVTPLLTIIHPGNKKYRLVLDGNHRLNAYRQAGSARAAVEHLDHAKVRLLPFPPEKLPEPREDQRFLYMVKRYGVPLNHFREPNGRYNMRKPRKELRGMSLNDFFANPNGEITSLT